MNILYQYYNEIVLAFNDFEVELREGVIVIPIPQSNKPFENVCEKVNTQLLRVADSLEARDREISVRVIRGTEVRDIILEKQL